MPELNEIIFRVVAPRGLDEDFVYPLRSPILQADRDKVLWGGRGLGSQHRPVVATNTQIDTLIANNQIQALEITDIPNPIGPGLSDIKTEAEKHDWTSAVFNLSAWPTDNTGSIFPENQWLKTRSGNVATGNDITTTSVTFDSSVRAVVATLWVRPEAYQSFLESYGGGLSWFMANWEVLEDYQDDYVIPDTRDVPIWAKLEDAQSLTSLPEPIANVKPITSGVIQTPGSTTQIFTIEDQYTFLVPASSGFRAYDLLKYPARNLTLIVYGIEPEGQYHRIQSGVVVGPVAPPRGF